jgi:hypothetical protein
LPTFVGGFAVTGILAGTVGGFAATGFALTGAFAGTAALTGGFAGTAALTGAFAGTGALTGGFAGTAALTGGFAGTTAGFAATGALTTAGFALTGAFTAAGFAAGFFATTFARASSACKIEVVRQYLKLVELFNRTHEIIISIGIGQRGRERVEGEDERK